MSSRNSPPAMTEHQRAAGREKATAARRVRAELKRQLSTGRIDLTDLFRIVAEDDERGQAAMRLRVGEVLLALPGIGRTHAEELLVRQDISGQRRIGQLGERQRERLVAAV
ncbi:MAG: hypothetical protein K0U60_00810 [Actinomycetia bacterium]|nr:hypothetical protein [Actinomycetes bacterium]MCH9800571.1 hypothetical protein [Actinomycetes bacterium]